MTEVVRTRNPWKTVAMVLIAVMFLLVVALASLLQPAATTGESGPADQAANTGVSGPTDNPYIDRHSDVVARMLH